MVRKLVLDIFLKIRIGHFSRSTVWNVLQFSLTVCPTGGLPKYIKTKVLTTCFDFTQSFSKKQKEVGPSLPASFSGRCLKKNIFYVIFY